MKCNSLQPGRRENTGYLANKQTKFQKIFAIIFSHFTPGS